MLAGLVSNRPDLLKTFAGTGQTLLAGGVARGTYNSLFLPDAMSTFISL